MPKTLQPVQRKEIREGRTAEAAATLWGKSRPAERSQIVAFIKATTEPKRLVGKKWVIISPWEGVPYYLTYISNLETGRQILTAGCAGPECGVKGLTANQIRRVVGLPPVKGGDYKIVVKDRTLTGGVSLGEIRKGVKRLPSRSSQPKGAKQ